MVESDILFVRGIIQPHVETSRRGKQSSQSQVDLHIRHVQPNARTRAPSEIVDVLAKTLPLFRVDPPFRLKGVRVMEYVGVQVVVVYGNGDVDALGNHHVAVRHVAVGVVSGQPAGDGVVESERFVDDGRQVRKFPQLLEAGQSSELFPRSRPAPSSVERACPGGSGA